MGAVDEPSDYISILLYMPLDTLILSDSDIDLISELSQLSSCHNHSVISIFNINMLRSDGATALTVISLQSIHF